MPDQTIWIADAIMDALWDAGWLVPYKKPKRPVVAPTRDLPPGVTRREKPTGPVVRATINCSWPGKRLSITLGTLPDTPENITRLSRMWQAARACYQAGGTVEAIKAAAQQVAGKEHSHAT